MRFLSPAVRISEASSSLQAKTNHAELGQIDGVIVTGRFTFKKDISILELTSLPSISYWGKGDIGEMEFLHDFSKEVSRPIERDDRIHIEYLPTQAFTEYIRYRFQVNNGSPLDGIMFNSSIPNAGKNVVLFATKKIVLSMLNSLTSKFIHEFLNIGEMQIKITIFIKI